MNRPSSAAAPHTAAVLDRCPLGCRYRRRHTGRSFWRLGEARRFLLPRVADGEMHRPWLRLGRPRRRWPRASGSAGHPCSRTSSSPRLTTCWLAAGPSGRVRVGARRHASGSAGRPRARAPRSPSARCGRPWARLLSGRLPGARFIRLRQHGGRSRLAQWDSLTTCRPRAGASAEASSMGAAGGGISRHCPDRHPAARADRPGRRRGHRAVSLLRRDRDLPDRADPAQRRPPRGAPARRAA